MNLLRERKLSEAAIALMQFDADSIRQVVSAHHRAAPDVWLADPDAYERNGRILRDSESSRMVAYSTTEGILYATDGCNACTRRLPVGLERLPAAELEELANNGFPLELLHGLARLIQGKPGS